MEKDKRVYKRICNGRYSILKILGEGAMGRVYLAKDEVSGKEVALKMVPREVSGRKDRLEELRQNYDRVESLHHPNIVAVKHLLKIPELGEYALMMEYVPGPTLLEYRKTQAGRRIEIAQAVKFAVEIAAGLDCAHRRGIVHRDIKPENIIVAGNTEARIADFGLARRIDTVAAASPEEFRKAMSGTYEYMAPEQWHCEKPDMYTDIYSLGATVYEMVSGRRPFEEAPDLAVLKLSVETDEPRSLLDFFPEDPHETDEFKKQEIARKRRIVGQIDEAVKKAMAKKKEDRFRTAGKFAEALKKALRAGDAVPDQPPPKPRWVGPAVVAAVLLVAAGALSFFTDAFGPRKTPEPVVTINDLTVDDIIDRQSNDNLSVEMADTSLRLMKLVLNDAKNDLPELRFAVLDITDNIADEKCAELGAPLRMKVAGGVKRLNGKLTGKRIGVDEITAEQLRPFKNLSRKTFTEKDLPDQEVTNFMERGGILIRGFWQKNADEIVLQLVAHSFSKIAGGQGYRVVFEGEASGNIPRSYLNDDQLGCLRPYQWSKYSFGGDSDPGGEGETGIGAVSPPALADLRVETTPEGATVFIDGAKQGRKSPLTVEDLAVGKVEVKAELSDDFAPAKKTVALRPEADNRVELAFKRVRTRLSLDVEPEYAEVRLDGVKGGYAEGMSLELGNKYSITVSAPGYKTMEQELALEEIEKNEIKVRLERGAIEDGFLAGEGMKFVFVEPGHFIRGTPEGEGGDDRERPARKVVFERGFYMQTTEVTQGQWKKIMGDNPSYFKECGSDCPVEQVSWEDAKKFILKLNEEDGKYRYRLPTEAEWEYAARAGKQTAFANGDMTQAGCEKDPNLDAMGWYCYNSGKKTHPVKNKEPNKWGLYDMHGNVWEWVEDDWHGSYKGAPTEGSAWIDNPRGARRVVRGGSWGDVAGDCRSAFRGRFHPGFRHRSIGFRLACLPKQEAEEKR